MFYAQSTSTVISERARAHERERERGREREREREKENKISISCATALESPLHGEGVIMNGFWTSMTVTVRPRLR